MKENRKKIIICISAIILVTFAVCCKSIRSLYPVTHQIDEAPAHDSAVFDQAVAALTKVRTYQIELNTDRTVILSDQQIKESSSKVIACRGYGTTGQEYAVEESLRYGDYQVESSERFIKNTAYLKLGNAYFLSKLKVEDYAADLPGIGVLNSDLYRFVNCDTQEDGSHVISFTSPAQIEKWACPKSSKLLDASGIAVIDPNGKLKEVQYHVLYEADGAQVVVDASAVYVPVDSNLFVPVNKTSSKYTSVSSIHIPKLLERSCGYLIASKNVTSEIDEKIWCRAGNLQRTQHTEIEYNHTDDELDSKVTTNVDLVDNNQGGAISRFSQKEVFNDGKYAVQVSEGDDTPVPSSPIDETVFKKYCQDKLVGSILLPQYIEAFKVNELSDYYLIIFEGTDELGQFMTNDAAAILYQDPDAFYGAATARTYDVKRGMLAIQKGTFLPISSGIAFEGTHTLQNTAYPLNSSIRQVYHFS